MPVFKRILAAVDGTELAEEVLETAIALSKRFDAEVHVVHAVHEGVLATLLKPDDEDGETVMGPDGPVETDEPDDPASVVRRMRDHAAMLGTGIEVHTPEGSPGEEIVRVAVEVHADLIVLGGRERSLMRRLLVGSVSEYVVENSPVSTLIVKPGT
jgi:nucleotide-binding universal stress UspA family protein